MSTRAFSLVTSMGLVLAVVACGGGSTTTSRRARSRMQGLAAEPLTRRGAPGHCRRVYFLATTFFFAFALAFFLGAARFFGDVFFFALLFFLAAAFLTGVSSFQLPSVTSTP